MFSPPLKAHPGGPAWPPLTPAATAATPACPRRPIQILSPLLGTPENAGATQHFWGSPEEGRKSELAASPLPSPWAKRGRNCYVTPASEGGGGPRNRGHNQNWLPHPCLLGGPKEGENALSPLRSRGSPKRGDKHGSRRASGQRPLGRCSRAVINRKKTGS